MKFCSDFHDHFIPWSMREEICSRFENLRQDVLYIEEYEDHFCELSRRDLDIIPNETERIRRFLRGLAFSMKSYMFRSF